MIIQWQGKGILVVVYLFAPLIGSLIATKLIEESFFDKPFSSPVYQIVSGLSVVFSGFLSWRNADDFYVDADGEKQYMDFNHRFMWLDLNSWAYIFWVFGGFTLVSGITELIPYTSTI